MQKVKKRRYKKHGSTGQRAKFSRCARNCKGSGNYRACMKSCLKK